MRRCVSLLLIVAFVASEAAVLPHAHASETPEKTHSLRHLHLSETCGHHHGHSHDAHPHSHCGCESQNQPLNGLSADQTDHDADALYLADVAACLREFAADSCGSLVALPTPIPTLEPVNPAVSELDSLAHRSDLAALSAEHCALFVKLCALRN